jgi:mRNA interferase RelE/StbE
MELTLVYTYEFKKDLKKIKDTEIQKHVEKIIQRILNNPKVGKPLCYELSGLRSMRVSPFRLIYEIMGDKIVLHKFEHRKKVYK